MGGQFRIGRLAHCPVNTVSQEVQLSATLIYQ